MTVVVVSDYASFSGGQARIAVDGALAMAARGERVIFFAAAGPVCEPLARGPVEVVCLDQHDLASHPSRARAAVQGLWNRAAARRLAEVLAGLPRDTLVHVHGWAKALSPSIGQVLAASGRPCVYSLHEYFLACPTGSFYDFGGAHVCTRRPLSPACLAAPCDPRSAHDKAWRVARQALAWSVGAMPRQFRHFIYQSDLQIEVLRAHLPKAARWHRVMNPIRVPRLGPKDHPADGPFVFVGRLSPEKGALLFAEAAEAAGVEAVFVGDGYARPAIEARFPRARILGWLPAHEVHRHVRGARALVMPSVWYEGQPLTAYESLALGTPLIVSDACAGREAVVHGRTGLRFASQDAGALAEALRALGDDARAGAMSGEAYDRYWRDPLTVEAHAAGLARVYACVRAEAGARPAPAGHLAPAE